ncbi:hypothetical protein ACQCLI_18345 [Pseudomonas nitroreducens]|uniref:hypothetical protein n=1 Tax=Pseudomonas nitroreducens TaxID=46680 RepID=UPI000382C93C|nr:hypothetical protein [Pseudomonas nitroreducens]
MNREDVAKDLAVENNEVLRKRVFAAEALLAEWEATFGEPAKSGNLGQVTRDFLASQQGEATAAESAQVHPEQAEGAHGERERFRANYKHLDLSEKPDAWGRTQFLHSHVEALWQGWSHRAALAQPSPTCSACHGSEMVFTDKLDHNGNHIEVDCPDCAQPSPAPELVHCACGDAFPVNSYGAGFMDANNGVCQNCDAATVAQAGQVPEEVRRAAMELVAYSEGSRSHQIVRCSATLRDWLAAAPAQGGSADDSSND